MGCLKLQALWLDNSLGLSVNQQVNESYVPLTSYYFWPVNEAWEQIRFELESKPWISDSERIKLLNLIVDIMNQWQQACTKLSGNNEDNEKIESILDNTVLVGLP